MSSRITKTISSAPGKLMLFGEHAVVYGSPCIVTAVEQRIVAEVASTNTQIIELNTPTSSKKYPLLFSESIHTFPKEHQFALAAVRQFLKKHPLDGLKIDTQAAFSSQFGFGSSSAVTVAILHALHTLYEIPWQKEDLFQMAYACVQEVQGLGSGFDLASAIWGGTIMFDGKKKTVHTLQLPSIPLLVAYTGKKADTATLVKQVAQLKDTYPEIIDSLFSSIAQIVLTAKEKLEQADWESVGILMNINQQILEGLNVGSSEITDTLKKLQKIPVWGAKLSGAGGGDCVIAISDPTSSVKPKLAEILPVELQAQGVRTEDL